MADLVRGLDWSSTTLGPMESWSEVLLAIVNMVLCAPIPSALYWGPERILIYNDGFRPFAGSRHPDSLGAPGAVVWKEAWHILGPQLDASFATGKVTHHENFLLPLLIDGRMQDLYWTYSFSPVHEQGEIAGVFNVCQSTTAQVAAERSLRESESRAHRILESIGDAVIVTDGEGRVAQMNPVAEDLTGWENQDAVGRPLSEIFRIVDESSREVMEGPADKVKRLGTVIGFANHTILIRRDGSEVHIDDSGAPIRGDSGELIGIVLVFRNVGEKRRMERERMRAAERDHENAVTQELLLRLFQEQRETTDSRAMMLAAAEAVGLHLGVDRTGFFEIIAEHTSRLTVCWTAGELPLLSGDVPLATLGEGYLAEALAGITRGVTDYATDPMTRDSAFGAIGVRSGIGVPIFRHGKWHTGFYVHCSRVRPWTDAEVAFVRDVAYQTLDSVELAQTQQAMRRSEARARKILESIGDAVIVTDGDTLIARMNPIAEELTGWSFEDARGRCLTEILRLVNEETGEPIQSAIEEIKRLGTITETEAMLVRRDGIRLHIDQTGSPMREDDGSISGMVMIFRDITDRSRAERRLRQAYKMEALGQLTGGIAHDFNNILAIIMGNLELIAEATATDAIAQERIEQAVASAERAADLTRRLLAYARQQPLDPAVVDVVHLVHAAAEFIGRSLGPAVVLQVAIGEGLWPARIDRNQFENALLNLAVNARDAMPGGGTLHITCENCALEQASLDTASGMSPGDYLKICVTDTGVGMSSEALARATEPFFTTKPIGQGTGLGLSMVYGFLKQSGGHLQIESQWMVGTKVILYLPRAVLTGQLPAAARERKLPAALPRGDELVLIVEDELAIRRTIGYLLHSLGYRVLEAEDGPNAVVHLKTSQSIDLLLTDVVLPNGMSGPELASEAKVLQPGMRVIFSSGYTSNVLARDYSLEEGVHLLNKPFHLAELAKMVRSVLDLSKL